MPGGTESLSEFTLILQDIATLNVAPSDGSLPANVAPPLYVTLWVVQGAFKAPEAPANANFTVQIDKLCVNGKTLNIGGHLSSTPDDKNKKPNTAPNTDCLSAEEKQLAPAPEPVPAPAPKEVLPLPLQCAECPRLPAVCSGCATDGMKLGSAYSQTLVFRVDRVVRPQCRAQVEHLMQKQMKRAATGERVDDPVQITWAQWMAWTTPYQGQRTSVKPGTETSKPLAVPPTRLLPPRGQDKAFELDWGAEPPTPPPPAP